MTEKGFKEKKTFISRKRDSEAIVQQYPDKVPVIIERYKNEKNLPILDKVKYLVPYDMTIGSLCSIVRYLEGNNRLNKEIDQRCWGIEKCYEQKTVTAGYDMVKQLAAEWKKRLQLLPSQSLFLLVNSKNVPSNSATLGEVHLNDKDDDGFVYIVYASQEMFWVITK